MILVELVLQNFGVYRGRHTIALEPPSASRPVVLFGGMNGYGKTTILDAIQLALYGHLARTSSRGDLGYEEYLRRAVHRSEDTQGGTAVELAFEHTVEGTKTRLRVRRAWSAGKAPRERLSVERNGVDDPVLADVWAEAMEELIPYRLAPFFFFDGEKIEALADTERSAEALAAAVRSLLGLDLVDQLTSDLVTFERRKKSEGRTNGEALKVETTLQALAEAETHMRFAKERADDLRIALDLAKKRASAADDKWRRAGGETQERSQRLGERKAAAKALHTAASDKLLALADGPMPLLAVPDLLASVGEATRTVALREARAKLQVELAHHDELVLEEARKAGADENVIHRLAAVLESHRQSFNTNEESPPYRLSEGAAAELVALQSHLLEEAKVEAAKAVADFDEANTELERIERTEQAGQANLLSELEVLREEAHRVVEETNLNLKAAIENEEKAVKQHEERRKEVENSHYRALDRDFAAKETERVLAVAEAARRALPGFKKLLAERKVARLSELILEGYQRLLAKPSLITRITIDPGTLHLELFGPEGQMSPRQLSAAERQLLAVSVLWGLARASGRSMPVVIDTPLGRLDSAHRAALVQRYFPVASRQVILLSTDREIDQGLFDGLASYIGRSYILRHDHKKGAARVEEGYFF